MQDRITLKTLKSTEDTAGNKKINEWIIETSVCSVLPVPLSQKVEDVILMNRKKRTISYVLTLVLVLNTLSFPTYGADTTYSGVPSGQALIENGSFKDIKGNANSEDIMKMSVYSIVREYGSNTYRPNQAATKQDMLAALVRAIGKQEEAVKQGETLKLANPSLNPVNAYLMGHMQVAQSSGIVNQSEIGTASTLTDQEKAQIKAEADKAKKTNWKMTKAQYDQLVKQLQDERSYQKAFRVPVTREEAALWIARALQFQPVTGEEMKNVFSYKDWNSIKTENLPYIEEVLKRGIMKGTSGNFSPKGTITRGEMAAIMSAVADQSLASLGYTKGFGKVADVSVAKDFEAPTNTYTTSIAIETPASGTFNVNVRKKSGVSSSNQEAVPVIKDGKLGDETLVSEGDIVEYTLTKDNKVLLLQAAKLKEVDGIFVVYDPKQNTVQMTDKSNNTYFLKVMPDSVIKAQTDPVDVGRIEPGSSAKAIYANNMLKALTVEIPPELISGSEMPVKILYADTLGNVIKVADEYDNKQYLELADNVAVYINGKLQGIDAIGFDQDAVVRVLNGKVCEVSVITDMQNEDDYHDTVFTAQVKDVDSSGITLIKDSDPGKAELYTIDANAPVIKDKNSVSPSVLRQGDRVKVYLNTSNDKHITKLEVQGEGLKVEKVYKGDIKDVVEETGEVILSNVYSYRFYGWVKEGDYIKYKLSDNAELYKNGYPMSKDQLKDNIGKSIYAASKKNYGSEELVKAVFKDGYEDTLNKGIQDVKWTTKQMTLSDGRVLGFNDGSIVIKDGRLLDSAYLGNDANAFIIQNKSASGVNTAPVINLDGFNDFSNYTITRGYIYDIGEDYYAVENTYTLLNNQWSESGNKTYLFSNETSIYDYVFDKAAVTPDKFAESRYKPYKYLWPNYRTAGTGADYHDPEDEYHYDYENKKGSSKYHEHILTYTISDENGNAQGVYMFKKDKDSFKPDPVFAERLASGVLNSIDVANDIISLKDAREYSAAYGEWRPVMANVTVSTEKAFVFKGGKQIQLSELNPQDNLNIISQDGYALLILVQE